MSVRKPENRPWKVLSSRYLSRKAWLTVRCDSLEMPDGGIVPEWYVLEFPDWVNVIATDQMGRMVAVTQYRHGLGRTDYELPAGVVDPKDASPLDAAMRELEEETGYSGGIWSHYMTLSPNPTNHNNLVHTFLAEGVVPGTAHPERSEDIRTVLLERHEMLSLLREGRIIQALMAAPLWRYFSENR